MNAGFYALSNAWLFALIVPLVVFYFLKLKRPRLQVLSLALWRQVMEDRRVNSPFQRFKRNLLLLLQILLLLLLVFAALQPFWRGGAARAMRTAVLIDSSASMAALDKRGGASRLAAAKEAAKELINKMLPDQELCLVTFSRTARRRCEFTNNKRILLEALDEIQIEETPSDIEDAFRMVQAMARSTAIDEVLLLSDGNFPERAHFELSFSLNYHRLDPAGPNLGITSLSARRSTEGMWDVFVFVEGSADAEGAATVEVRQDGQQVGSELLSVTKGKGERIIFRVSGDKPSDLEVKLVPEDFDSLFSDNVAYLHLPAARRLQVVAPDTVPAYRHALGALGGVNVLATDEGSLGDLLITDRESDLGSDVKTALFIGVIPSDLKDLVSIAKESTRVVDWDRGAPLLRHVELNDVLIIEHPVSADGVSESDFENLGYVVLVHGDKAPLVLEKREGDRLRYFMLFHSDRSTLPYRVGFPVLVFNLIQIAMNEAGLSEAHPVQTGVLRNIAVRPDATYQVKDPQRVSRTEHSGRTGVLSGIPAPRVGYYGISGGSDELRLGASLLSANETSLQSVEKIQFDEDLAVSATKNVPPTDRSLWPMLVLIGFCVLLVEWWYYQIGSGGHMR